MGKRFGDTEFTQPEKELVMLVCVLAGGNSHETHRQLLANPPENLSRIPSISVIKEWKHTQRYTEIQREQLPKIKKHVSGRALEVAMAAQEGTLEAIEETRKQIKAGTIKDPSAAAKNLTLTQGIQLDKHQMLEGLPTNITEHRDAAQLISALADKGIFIDSTAEEEPVPALGTGA